MGSPRPGTRPPGFSWLRVIAVWKIGKVILLLLTAYGALRLRDASVIEHLTRWAAALPTGFEQGVVQRALVWISGLSPRRISALGIVTLIYAAIFALEGVGLWLGKLWAEWLTIIITGSLIPFELWEAVRRPGTGRFIILVANVAVVWYLVYELRRHRKRSS